MTQERPNPELPETQSPTEATQEDITKIAEYRSHGKSLGASVALTIGTGNFKRAHQISSLMWQGEIPIEQTMDSLLVYAPAKSVLDSFITTEEFLRSGQVAHVTEEIFGSPEQQRNAQMVAELTAILFKTSPIVQDTEQSLDLENQLVILKQRGALGFVDYMTGQLVSAFEKLQLQQDNPLPNDLILKELENNRQRFHNLYQAAQEAGLG